MADVGDFIERPNESDHGRVGVRRADLTDAAAIAAVHVASWEDAYRGMVPGKEIDRRTVAWRTTMWQEVIAGTGDPFDGSRPWAAVAVRDGATIGLVSLGAPRRATATPSTPSTARTAEITALYVTPASWRAGAGTALMRAALTEAAERGCADVTLWVLEPNLRARAFYERHGFADDGGRQTDREGWPVEIRMRRVL
jgi:ribosomal protein S18 acetylase RimI-like enzyme